MEEQLCKCTLSCTIKGNRQGVHAIVIASVIETINHLGTLFLGLGAAGCIGLLCLVMSKEKL